MITRPALLIRRILTPALKRLPSAVSSALLWQLTSGVVLFIFLTMHMFNHALGLISLDAMEYGRLLFLLIWRSSLGTMLLIAAFLIHAGLALGRLAKRRTFKSLRFWEGVQIALGLLIPFLLIDHLIGTRAAHQIYGVDDYYAIVLLMIWKLSPGALQLQIAATLTAWIHGCMGIYFMLRLKPWFHRAAPILLTMAVMIPTLGLLGFVEGAREAVMRTPDPASIRQLLETTGYSYPGLIENLTTIAQITRNTLIALLILLFIAIALRKDFLLRRNIIHLNYPDGKTIKAHQGWSVLDAARYAQLPHVSVCGGRGRCSTCRVRVGGDNLEKLPPPSERESLILRRIGASPSIRLACQLYPQSTLSITPLLSSPPRQLGAIPAFSDFTYGRDRDIAVLFADLYGFTQFSEKKLPYDVVFFLNRYNTLIGGAIQDAGGRIDKFIGDGVMALFGIRRGPVIGSRNAIGALACMAEAMTCLNAEFASELHHKLRLRVGIHTGPAIVGTMGHTENDAGLTAIGNSVNLASRLEALNKTYDSEVVISKRTAQESGYDFSEFELKETTLRGQTTPIAFYLIRTLVETTRLHQPPSEEVVSAPDHR